MAKYSFRPEMLYAAAEEIAENPEVVLPKKWQFLKVETVLKRGKGWDVSRAPTFSAGSDVSAWVADVLSELGISDRERIYSVFLNQEHQPIGIHAVSIGTASETLAHPRELFKAALLANSSAIILAHNHPSGSLNFSDADRLVASRISEVGKILGITMLDFLVIGGDKWKSGRDEGMIEP